MLNDEDKGDIRTLYRQAAHPQKQIVILAQLYAVPKKEIRRVLGLIETPPYLPDTGYVPATFGDGQERRAWSEEIKQAVVQQVLMGKGYKEAGTLYGVPTSTVGTWVFKWRRRQEQAQMK